MPIGPLITLKKDVDVEEVKQALAGLTQRIGLVVERL